jgi:epoxide hydrolase-like predicted phosphatase
VVFEAVIFDLGGVVLGSPLQSLLRYESERGLEPGFLGRLITRNGERGAWQRLERGELGLEAFYAAFDAEARAAGAEISSAELMTRIEDGSPVLEPVVEAIRRVRAHGLRAGALTNNWFSEDQTRKLARLRPHFDVMVESAREGMRKPDPRIYAIACQRLSVSPPRAVFLDDIGANLKAARDLAMTTIKVSDPLVALEELERVLGLPLR